MLLLVKLTLNICASKISLICLLSVYCYLSVMAVYLGLYVGVVNNGSMISESVDSVCIEMALTQP